MADYSIRDLEQLSGIKAHTIRIWEKRYKLLSPDRSSTNIRNYSASQLKLVLNVSLLRNHGLKISEIAKFSGQQIERKVNDISMLRLNYPDQIQALTTAMIEFDEDRFEKILNLNIEKFGFENLMLYIIYPFLSKIGVLWVTGAIGPAQEHFMSSLIRQKLIAAIDKLPKIINNNPKTIVLFLPEGEYHEIGLLFTSYIFKSKGHKVIYLGQSLPDTDLAFVCELYKPNFIFTVMTSAPTAEKLQVYLNWLSTKFSTANIFVTGYQVLNKKLTFGKNVSLVSDIESLQKIVGWIG
ncbi:MAG: MerR family transcriptional regulator [Bacteroidota bacterium]